MKNNKITSKLKDPWVALLILTFITVIIYSNIYDAPFVFDDLPQIVENGKIRTLERCISPRQLFSPRPLVVLTYALNYKFGALNVFGYHVVNVIIHVINGFIVYFLSLIIFKQLLNFPTWNSSHNHPNSGTETPATERLEPALKNVSANRQSAIPLMSLFTALIFVVHPLQTQAVTYTVQRYTSLSAMFYFLSIFLYIKARMMQRNGWQLTRPSAQRITISAIKVKLLAAYIFCILCGVLAFLSKQNTASLPGAILLVEYVLFERTWQGWKRKLVWLGPAFLMMGIFILYVSGVFRSGIHFGGLLEDVSGILRSPGADVDRRIYFCTQLNVIVIYIRLLFLPVGQNLDYMYPFKSGFFDGYTPAAFLFLVALVVIGIWQIKRRPVISFGIFWFFITLSVESSFFPITDALFEHRLYLPMFGFAMAISFLVFCSFSLSSIWRMVTSFLIIAALGSATYLRNRTYESKLKMWSDVVSKSPQNVRAYYNLGNALYKSERPYDAIRKYSEALRIRSDYVLAHLNLGVVLMEVGRLQEAVSHLSEALRMRPWDAGIHNNLGYALMKSGRLEDAIQHFSKAILIAPRFGEAYNNMGTVLARQGKLEEAKKNFYKAENIKPNNIEVQINLAQTLLLEGDLDKASEHLSKAIHLKPGYAEAHYKLGIVLMRQRRVDKAITHFSKALELKPDFTEAFRELNRALRVKTLSNPPSR